MIEVIARNRKRRVLVVDADVDRHAQWTQQVDAEAVDVRCVDHVLHALEAIPIFAPEVIVFDARKFTAASEVARRLQGRARSVGVATQVIPYSDPSEVGGVLGILQTTAN